MKFKVHDIVKVYFDSPAESTVVYGVVKEIYDGSRKEKGSVMGLDGYTYWMYSNKIQYADIVGKLLYF